MSPPKRIVILGAGFGGLEAMVEFERRVRRRSDVELWLVSEHNYFLFKALLPQVVSSYVEPRHIIQSIRDLRGGRRFRFRRAGVTGIDFAARRVRTTDGELPYDYLVIAIGCVTNFFGVEGAELCYPLNTLEDAVLLRDHILDLCEHANHEPSLERKRRLLTIVVVGGGITGIETAAELSDFFVQHIVPRYHGIEPEDARLVLLEATPELLAGVDPILALHARRKLVRRGIEVRTQARVARIGPGWVELHGGETLEAGLVIWAAGVRAHPMLESLPTERNRAQRILVTPELHLPGRPEVFAIGDNAIVQDAPLEATMQVAPVAMGQARLAAENVARALAGQPYARFDYTSPGMLVSLGMNDAVVKVMGFRFSGYFAWLFWNAVHLFRLVGLKKQFQVGLDWSLSTVFPRDTSIIRSPRRCRLCHPQLGPT